MIPEKITIRIEVSMNAEDRELSLEPYIEIALDRFRAFQAKVKKEIDSGARPVPSPPKTTAYSPAQMRYDSFDFTKDKDISVFLHTDGTIYDPFRTERKFAFHDHDFYEINYLYRGSVENLLLDSRIMQKPSQLLLMSPYAVHYANLHSVDTILFNIMIRKDFFSNWLPNLGMSPLKPYILFENTTDIHPLICEIIREYYIDEPYSQLIIGADLTKIFAILRRGLSLRETNALGMPANLRQALFYMQEHFPNVTLRELAAYTNFSKDYLGRNFKKYLGRTFREVYYEMQMQKAVFYLLYTDYNIATVAELLHCTDAGHFRKLFHKTYHMSPTKYRKKFRQR